MRKEQTRQPIGYWLKAADRAITDYAGRKLGELGLTRFHWQVLNIVHRAGSISGTRVY